jgi:WhiB family redox-sensing transcriptional regulator
MADIRRLPVPVTDIWDWQMRGACRGMDSGFFFHPEGERGPARANREARAKEVCRSCPVLEQCRRHALAVHEPYGVWGGLSEAEREEIIRGRTRRLRVRSEPSVSAGS